MSRSLVEVWFWVDDPKSQRHFQIFAGELKVKRNYSIASKICNGEKLYEIISHDGFITYVSENKIYDTEEECVAALRDFKLKSIGV